ncbi:putative divalent cation/proton antiporter TMEM165 isoform X1 [Haliotis cracherodii]|uniref:putative divalent cation/proton antiporter TMEM165 isoform X1 n=1 Tax=Haliotis cracherodii TaxID=6455 RepID=UPI0039ED763B
MSTKSTRIVRFVCTFLFVFQLCLLVDCYSHSENIVETVDHLPGRRLLDDPKVSETKNKDKDKDKKKDQLHALRTSEIRLARVPRTSPKTDEYSKATHSSEEEEWWSDEHGILHHLRKRKGDLGFIHGFVASLSVIIVSELGDKTFFIAAIMAMRHSRLTVLTGALGALIFMTILSGLVGYATTVIPRAYTYYISSLLFAVFGIKMLKEGWSMSPDEGQDEYEEVQADLKKREDELQKQNMPTTDIETGIIRTPGRRFLSGLISTVLLQSFTLTFLAEWGDRSQIATIVLAAREEIWGVLLGGFLGHALCTGLAVIGGRMIAQRISVRTVTLIGGVVFILFAFSALFFGPDD